MERPRREAEETQAFALHEVSNALTVVLGWLDVGLRGESLDELKHALRVAREHAKRGQVLARRAIGAEVESSRSARSGGELAAFTAESLGPVALERGVRIEVQAAEQTDGTVNDEASLVQVLTNVLLNAVQFTPSGGCVRLSTSRLEGEFRFRVEDEGQGIPAERQAGIFSGCTSTRSGGAGLGLAHSRELARRCSGDILLLPSSGGAQFEIRWPVARTTGVLSNARVAPQRALAGTRILLIEDDAAVASLVEMTCESRGAEVTTVAERAQLSAALEQAVAFDVVLVDLSPLEGCLSESLDEIATKNPGARVILVSGQPSGVPEGAEGRFAVWVRKPFDMEHLMGSIAELLGDRMAAEHTETVRR